jgi:hypothetical protein
MQVERIEMWALAARLELPVPINGIGLRYLGSCR